MDETLRFSQRMGIGDNVVNQLRAQMQIVIKADRKTAERYSGQIMLEVSANLLARIFPHVSVVVDDLPAKHLKAAGGLVNHLRTIIKDSYNWIGYSDVSPSKTFYLVVGDQPITESAVYINANGWIAYVGTEPASIMEEEVIIPTGSIASACLGAAEVFKAIYEPFIQRCVAKVQDGVWLNTFTYGKQGANPSLGTVKLDRATLFGAGSVGSSLLYTLGFMPSIEGRLDVVDRDKKIDSKNLQRYTLLTVSDTERYGHLTKAQWAKEKMANLAPDLEIIPWDRDHGDVISYLNVNSPEPGIKLAISAVDNVESRIQIADCLAKRTINAGTGDTTLTITRHGFGDGHACLACEYINSIPDVNWYQQISVRTGIKIDRVAYLMQGGKLLTREDAQQLATSGFIQHDEIDGYINTDFASVVNRRLYAAVPISDQEQKVESPVTAPFVSLMAGALLAGEAIKEICGLQNYSERNKYQTNMLSIPERYSFFAAKGGPKCLCAHSFRRKKYQELWSTV